MKAFPLKGTQGSIVERTEDEYGMDLRDYFASKAMQAYIQVDPNDEFTPSWAYKMADAMMKEREAK